MNRATWQYALALEGEFKRRGKVFSRNMIQESMKCSVAQARLIDWGLKHRDIIRLKKVDDNIEAGKKVLILNDIHIPFQDQIALDAALQFGDSYRPDVVIILGDAMDFYQCSRFTRKVGKPNIKEELRRGRAFLSDLRQRFPDAKIIYLEGNHESHLERYILEHAVEIADLVDDLLINKLGLHELNIEYRKNFFRIGKLWYLHGHEKPGGGNAEYVTNVMFKYTIDHTIFGHHHRTQEKIFKRVDESTLWVGANGCLCGKLEYAPLNNWNHGFATIDYGNNGTFRAHLHKIQDGTIY